MIKTEKGKEITKQILESLFIYLKKNQLKKNFEKMRYIYSESLGLFFIIFNHYIIMTFHIFKSYFVQSSK